MRGRRLVYVAVATGVVLWVLYTPATPRPLYPIQEPTPPTELGDSFDPPRCGTVRGAVAWSGAVPAVPPIERVDFHNPPGSKTTYPNPNAPRVKDGRLADALVYLVGVDAHRSAPWTLPPAVVEAKQSGFVVKQGDRAGRIAIVRRGEAVELVSREPAQHSIRGRGAAFFTQMLPLPNRPVSRPMTDPGIVELSSGSSYYWLRGYLFVTDHPYAAVTGPDGTFALAGVPDGEYEAACWVPDWHIDRVESDPEGAWLGPARLFFRPALEKRQRVAVRSGQVTDLKFTLSGADFDR